MGASRGRSVRAVAGLLALALAVVSPDRRTDAQSPTEGPVIVSLRERVTVGGRVVALGDVAELTGGNAWVREKLAALDLADAPTAAEPRAVSRQQVLFRARLADIPERLFRIEGAPKVQVTFGRYMVPEADVLAAARRVLFQRLPWGEEDVSVQLVQPVGVPLEVDAPREDVTVRGEPHAAATPLGRVQMDMAVYVRGERRISFPLYLDVRLCQKMAVCTKKIERGEPLNESNVVFDRRPVEGLRDYYSAPRMLANKRARLPILPGSVVTASMVEDDGEKPGQVVIRQQEAVKMVVRLGPVTVTASGEALQDGRLGQLIRVRNVDSKQVVLGRVADKSLVEIDP